MATELRLINVDTGSAVYALLNRDSDETVWNGSTFVTRVLGSQASYDVPLSETPAGSRVWIGDLPAGIAAGTTLNVDYYLRAGATPASSDELIGSDNITVGAANTAPTPGNLISVSDYQTATGDTDTDTDTITWLITAATAAIEAYCSNKLTQEVGRTETYNGQGINSITLDAVPASVTSITLDAGTSYAASVDVNDIAWTAGGSLFFAPDSVYAAFPPGYQNVCVVYTTQGVVGADLKMACVMVIKNMMALVDSDRDVVSKSLKDASIKWAFPSFIDNADDPVFCVVRQLLAPYRRFLNI